jgi:hypothetical protein
MYNCFLLDFHLPIQLAKPLRRPPTTYPDPEALSLGKNTNLKLTKVRLHVVVRRRLHGRPVERLRAVPVPLVVVRARHVVEALGLELGDVRAHDGPLHELVHQLVLPREEVVVGQVVERHGRVRVDGERAHHQPHALLDLQLCTERKETNTVCIQRFSMEGTHSQTVLRVSTRLTPLQRALLTLKTRPPRRSGLLRSSVSRS